MKNKRLLTELFNEANKLSCEEAKYTTNDLLEMYKQIENDLEVLEMLKDRIHLKDNTLKLPRFIIGETNLPKCESNLKEVEIAFIEASGFVFKNSDDYKLLKGWLENE